ncbi:hypothetical protein [Micromonospora sp. L5]|uniref:hypothetical protein n=1 Tax=Micromonospora TaxID=1873 RepID=UPI0005A24257|nr:hypothetical protein [Micromonospora sp. L5]
MSEEHEEAQPNATDEVPAEAVPYTFLPAHVSFAIGVVDRALAGDARAWTAAAAIAEATAPDELGDVAALQRELCRAVTYSLRLARGDEEPGCELKVGGNGLLPAVRDLTEPVIQLWQAVAGNAREPAAIAQFNDLLWCRRVPGAGRHADRAARAYVQLAGTGDIDMRRLEFLLRAWTLTRQINGVELAEQTRVLLAQVADDVITDGPGERPGILLPILAALARGPLRSKKAPLASDPIDVDDLLRRAATVCQHGRTATAVARYRRTRTQDPATLRAIARDEVNAYFRDADTAPSPMVRMARLTTAAQIARDRGLGDLERRAVAGMQSIDMPWQTIAASTEVPAHRIEPFLDLFTRPADWQEAMDEFLESRCPTGDIAVLRALAADTRDDNFLSLILRPVRFADGLPRASAATEADVEKQELAFFAEVRAENYGRLVATGMYRLADRYGIPTEDGLVDYLLTRGARDPALARSLAKAFRHFWHRDIESCLHLATPKFEAAARALLIELDEGIYRAEAANSPGGYPGLYSLLAKLEDIALDESWAYFFTWLLAGPWGANLRNDIAHGLPTPLTPAYAVLVLRAVTLLAVVAGPAPITQIRTGDRRDRDEITALLSNPIGRAPRERGAWLGRAAVTAERLAWRLRVTHLRHTLRRRPRTP